MLKRLTDKLKAGESLEAGDPAIACEALLDETNSLEDRADFLRALDLGKIREQDLAGFAGQLLEHAVVFPVPGTGAIDVCGTGGDKAGLFNVSTAVMFVAAGAGARVIKHGNRGITSKSGGADVLEALGVRIDLPPATAAEVLDAVGCCFLFAPLYHPAVKAIAPVRQLLAREGTPTIFNLLGPLLNPARPEFQMVGVYDGRLLEIYARALKNLGRKRAWAVHGRGPDGFRLDEISTLGPTSGFVADADGIRPLDLNPADFGIPAPKPADLLGGSPTENAEILNAILSGKDRGGRRGIVVLNAAAALTVCGLADSLEAAIRLAEHAIDSGAAASKLAALREKSEASPLR
jgi:anthranilate phosphoribosyltransferase